MYEQIELPPYYDGLKKSNELSLQNEILFFHNDAFMIPFFHASLNYNDNIFILYHNNSIMDMQVDMQFIQGKKHELISNKSPFDSDHAMSN